ncbi:hypothetical protein DYB25_013011 [Aphanomyces astaci]|uniref:Adenylate kinase active site lid domain-containing protein n=1 Tax=Aphanomyces astaci TaxID=112090 RepID=A0A397B5Q4_APHAT|nr:hypothetical protein DYB25_013011 [Aphanomyces astaci]RHY44242.1 hypothetical protein DYB38_011471 [Aphanomyces astaci]RHY52188.1 hypothetical protein DYB30_007058 [Aphanomyces astaci]
MGEWVPLFDLLARASSTIPDTKRSSMKKAFQDNARMMFLGPPGVGKGTYASRIAPKLDIPTISTGDLVRAEIKRDSALGKQIKEFSSTGKLVPDDIILTMVRARLQEHDAKRGYILDGFPRNASQAVEFDKIDTLDLVVNFDLPEWVLLEKISGRRLQVYADETEPLIAYYEAKGVLKNFHVTKGLADLDRLMQVLLSGVDSIESKL